MTWLNSRSVGLALAALCTAFWLWFGVASAMAERLGATSSVLHLVVPGGILLLTILLAWKWEALGGALLIAEGLVVCVGYPIFASGRFPIFTVVMMLLTLALPPIVAGFLLVADARRAALRH